VSASLSQINVYPVKSAGGFSVGGWPLDEFGLQFDRRWAIIDSSGVTLTQRDYALMALARTAVGEEGLRIEAPGMPLLRLPLGSSGGSRLPVRIWKDVCEAERSGPEADTWWSAYLGEPCHMVRMPDETLRPAGAGRVGFADAFPFLILSEASLGDLNSRLEGPLPMNRFRPNLVVSGVEPYAEDTWAELRIGSEKLVMERPCGRCVVTTTDQATAARGTEPLRTLAGYRRAGSGSVQFGHYASHLTHGRLDVGDAVAPATRR
jgi:uncharacterized protein